MGENVEENRIKIIKEKEAQVMKILTDGDLTFGMAKTIIQSIEAELLREGSTFLNKSMLKNVLPVEA